MIKEHKSLMSSLCFGCDNNPVTYLNPRLFICLYNVLRNRDTFPVICVVNGTTLHAALRWFEPLWISFVSAENVKLFASDFCFGHTFGFQMKASASH